MSGHFPESDSKDNGKSFVLPVQVRSPRVLVIGAYFGPYYGFPQFLELQPNGTCCLEVSLDVVNMMLCFVNLVLCAERAPVPCPIGCWMKVAQDKYCPRASNSGEFGIG